MFGRVKSVKKLQDCTLNDGIEMDLKDHVSIAKVTKSGQFETIKTINNLEFASIGGNLIPYR